jgi:hypothetical protein
MLLRLAPVAARSASIWVRWPYSSFAIDGGYDSAQLKDGVLRVDLTIDQPVDLAIKHDRGAAG